MTRVIYLVRIPVLCSCGACIVPDPSLPAETVLHQCDDCRILQGGPEVAVEAPPCSIDVRD